MITFQNYLKLSKYSTNYTTNILLLHGSLMHFTRGELTQENIDQYLQVHNTHMARRAINLYIDYQKHIGTTPPPLTIKKLRKRRYFALDDISYTDQEIQELIHTANTPHDKLIIQLTYEGGLRVSETINIKRSDIDYDNNEIRVIGKGNKPRRVVFSKRTKSMLLDYLHTRDNFCPYLFIKEFNLVERQMTRHQALHLIKRIAKKAVPYKKATFHMLRHSRGRNLREARVDTMTIKDYLGHKNVNTTQIYTQVDQQLVRDEVRNILDSN